VYQASLRYFFGADLFIDSCLPGGVVAVWRYTAWRLVVLPSRASLFIGATTRSDCSIHRAPAQWPFSVAVVLVYLPQQATLGAWLLWHEGQPAPSAISGLLLWRSWAASLLLKRRSQAITLNWLGWCVAPGTGDCRAGYTLFASVRCKRAAPDRRLTWTMTFSRGAVVPLTTIYHLCRWRHAVAAGTARH